MIREQKSKNFDRNLNSAPMLKKIRYNTFKASEVLKQKSNSIAPVDTGKLRQNVTQVKSSSSNVFRETVTWQQPYAGVRYTKNKKNPQSKYWVKKGYKAKKNELSKIQRDGVIL